MGDLLNKRSRPAIGLKPEEAAVAEAKLLADFQAATQDKPDFDVASTVFAAAADTLVPVPQAILFLEGLLRARQPTAGWVEIVTLHRLAERAEAIVQGKLPARGLETGDSPESSWTSSGRVSGPMPAQALPTGSVPGSTRPPRRDTSARSRSMRSATFRPIKLAGISIARRISIQPSLQHRIDFKVRCGCATRPWISCRISCPISITLPSCFQHGPTPCTPRRYWTQRWLVSPAEMKSAASAETTGQTPGLEVLRAASDRIDRLGAESEISDSTAFDRHSRVKRSPASWLGPRKPRPTP